MYLRISSIANIMMLALCGPVCEGQQHSKKGIDLSKTVVVLPFESSAKKAGGLPEATRTAVIQFLKDESMFAAVLTPEEVKEMDKATLIEIGATLVDFTPGNMATRALVGLGSGRASASFDFTVKHGAIRDVLWQKSIKEKASFWSNSASSAAQRLELPEKIAKTLVKELKKAKAE